MIETILRWCGYVKARDLAIMKMELDGWKEAAESWRRVATSNLKERSVGDAVGGFVHLGPRTEGRPEVRH